ncbi:MAG: fasciclin domain-containing protein [Gaiella sp.]
MRIRTLAAALVACGALAASAAIAVPASAEPSQPTLFGAVAASLADNNNAPTDRNWYDFDILANGVLAAGLKDALDAPGANLTVFIPNDRAFQALVADLFGWKFWFAGEATVLGKIVELEKSAPGTLATVITYHAVKGPIDSKTALGVPKGTELTTLQGGKIKVFPLPLLGTAILVDQDTNDFDPTLVRSKLDIRASNGIAHGISLVLRPANL